MQPEIRGDPGRLISLLGDEVLRRLAEAFPVCSGSDEFHFFPQVVSSSGAGRCWDDFSGPAVDEVCRFLAQAALTLEEVLKRAVFPESAEASMLMQTARSLAEQLAEVRPQSRQPTFLLTVACQGIAGALESGDRELLRGRIAGLPGFIDRARENLHDPPMLFRDLGLEMISDAREWFVSLSDEIDGMGPAIGSLDRLEKSLCLSNPGEEFILDSGLYRRVVGEHYGCGSCLEELEREIDREIEENNEVLEDLGAALPRGVTWEDILRALSPGQYSDGSIDMYRREVDRLGRHCRDAGFMDGRILHNSPVRVREVPPHLRAVRSAAAYSALPGHPPRGGTFYIMAADSPQGNREGFVDPQYRMLAAHETYPGHHLLDASRWGLERPLLRHLEYPLFYEGWACYAEEILFKSGYFSRHEDRIILALRHLRRAHRGRVDIGIQSGAMDLAQAVDFLAERGWDRMAASSMVRKHALKPGYQVCYTIGLRKMRRLYEGTGADNPAIFCRTILSQGEIPFHHLEEIINNSLEK